MSLLLNQISGANLVGSGAPTESVGKIKKVFWGGEPGSESHPTQRYHCTALPLGWREITFAEFARSEFFHYTPGHTGWIRSVIGDARLFFMHNDTGYALVGDYWGEAVKVFKFGCRHEFAREEVGRCLTKETCKLCGFVQTIDSSD